MADEATTTALTKRDAAQLDQIAAAVLGDSSVLPPPADPEAMSRAIAERILSAETFEEAFGPQQLRAWQDLTGLGVLVRDVHFNRSTFGEGSVVYAVVDVERLDDGSTETVTCGGTNVLMQLVTMLRNGWQDRPVKLTAKPTAEGNEVLWLEAA